MGGGLTKQWLAALGTTRCIIASFTVADEQSINAASAKRVITGKNETIGSLLQTDRAWLSWDRARPCERHAAELPRQLQEGGRKAGGAESGRVVQRNGQHSCSHRACDAAGGEPPARRATRKCDDEDVLQARFAATHLNLREMCRKGVPKYNKTLIVCV